MIAGAKDSAQGLAQFGTQKEMEMLYTMGEMLMFSWYCQVFTLLVDILSCVRLWSNVLLEQVQMHVLAIQGNKSNIKNLSHM